MELLTLSPLPSLLVAVRYNSFDAVISYFMDPANLETLMNAFIKANQSQAQVYSNYLHIFDKYDNRKAVSSHTGWL